MRFELFPSDEAKDTFFKSVHAVSSALAKWPDDRVGGSGKTPRSSYFSSARSANG